MNYNKQITDAQKSSWFIFIVQVTNMRDLVIETSMKYFDKLLYLHPTLNSIQIFWSPLIIFIGHNSPDEDDLRLWEILMR